MSLCAGLGVREHPSHVVIDIGDILRAVERSGALNSDKSAQCSEKNLLGGNLSQSSWVNLEVVLAALTREVGFTGGGDSDSGWETS